MKAHAILWPLLLLTFPGQAQSTVTFSQLPRSLQLYPRNRQNQCTIPVQGRVTASGYQRISLQVSRQQQPWRYASRNLPADGSFQFEPIILAEPAEYRFRLYLHSQTDSTLVADRARVVCGDAILICGQSNAVALAGMDNFPLDDTYLRNCAMQGSDTTTIAWYPAKAPYGSVGMIGLRLQKLILERYGIPTCIINGAIGGMNIVSLSNRTPTNPADPATFYGRTLYRARWAGLDQHIRAIIWKQGENEAGSDAANYDQKFTTLFQQWRTDYNPATRVYVGQINILPDPQERAGELRDFQRRSKYLLPNVETIATVGAREYDGVHYGVGGNQQITEELFRQIARDLYGATDTSQINSPDIRKAYYSPGRDTLTLVFDESMRMRWPQDSTIYHPPTGTFYQRRMADFLYLNGEANRVSGGWASGNRVYLKLRQATEARQLTYLPSYFSDFYSGFYNGVHLTNERGMRAFSFYRFPIADQLPRPQLVNLRWREDGTIRLRWTAPDTNLSFRIERSEGAGIFRRIATVQAGTAFVDTQVPAGSGNLSYRVQALSSVAESPPSNSLSLQRAADLSLSMAVSERIVSPSEPVSITLTVRNAGPAPARGVLITHRLPSGVLFLEGSSGITHQNGLLTAQVPPLAEGNALQLRYRLRPQQSGVFRNRAEITSADWQDPDSQPASGTADGEDDAALAEWRTADGSRLLHESPNPNQRPLPPVQSNQPPAENGRIDLSLELEASQQLASPSEVIVLSLRLTNRGSATAQSVTAQLELPEEATLLQMSGLTVTGRLVTVQVPELPAGGQHVRSLSVQVSGQGTLLFRAQVQNAQPADVDSVPGNGWGKGEDDEASLRVRIRE